MPRVAVTACVKTIGKDVFHVAGRKYLTAVSKGAGCWPLILPSLGDWYESAMPWPESLFDLADGILLTGSPSDLEPAHYGATPPEPDKVLRDPGRDATVLSMIRPAIEAGVPLLALCRGLQEVNVAFGGTLHQEVHGLPGHMDHRSDPEQTMEQQYAAAHPIQLTPGGQLSRLAGGRDRVHVNSVHGQAVDRVGKGLAVEAVADDGTIEAVRVEDAPGFALAVQWHPEWQFWNDPLSSALFRAFGDAVRARSKQTLT